jgi:hypothetical protein
MGTLWDIATGRPITRREFLLTPVRVIQAGAKAARAAKVLGAAGLVYEDAATSYAIGESIVERLNTAFGWDAAALKEAREIASGPLPERKTLMGTYPGTEGLSPGTEGWIDDSGVFHAGNAPVDQGPPMPSPEWDTSGARNQVNTILQGENSSGTTPTGEDHMAGHINSTNPHYGGIHGTRRRRGPVRHRRRRASAHPRRRARRRSRRHIVRHHPVHRRTRRRPRRRMTALQRKYFGRRRRHSRRRR